jgi:hypothetical protein
MTPTECAELFAKTLEELNAVSQLQMQGILNIVISGLEAVKSTSSDNAGVVQPLSELIDDLKNAMNSVGKVPVEPIGAPDQTSDNFCAEVEANINLAMKNSLANQQQLNVIGAAALTKIINLLISLKENDLPKIN